jgi:hypothetical protein
MGPNCKAGLAAGLLCGGLMFGLQASSAATTARHIVSPGGPPPPAESSTPSAPEDAPADGPATIKAALQEMAEHFGFALVGANRLSNDPPSWPSEDLPEVQMLHALLRDYSYIVVLKPKAGPSGEREPAKVMIVSHNPTPAAPPPEQPHGPPPRHAITPPYQASALPATAAVASAESSPTGHVPSWAPPPSTVVKTLAKLASTSGVGAGGAQAGDTGAAPAPAVPNPAEDANAMASLTRSAQAGLGALVTGLRQACPNPNAC